MSTEELIKYSSLESAVNSATDSSDLAQEKADLADEKATIAQNAATDALLSADVDEDYVSYDVGVQPSTSGATEGTIGAYFPDVDTFQKLELVSGSWADVGEPIPTKNYVDDKASLLVGVHVDDFGANPNAPKTGAVTAEHDSSVAFQAAADYAYANGIKKVLFGPGCYVINTESDPTWGRVYFEVDEGDEVIVQGAGKNNTFIRNTIQMPSGDMFASAPVGGYPSTASGFLTYRDFTVLETFQGATDGTGGCNPLTAVYSDGIRVHDVRIEKSGNRAIAIENGSEKDIKLVDIQNVDIEDSWKNAISINSPQDLFTTIIIIDNVFIDGFNLLANAGGSNTDQNNGINIVTGANSDVVLYLGDLQVKNGFASALVMNNGTIIHGGIFRIDDLEIIDVSTSLNQVAIKVNDADFYFDNIEIKNITNGGGIYVDNATDKIPKIESLSVENSDYAIRSVGNEVVVNDINSENNEVAVFGNDVYVNAGRIVGQYPQKDASGNFKSLLSTPNTFNNVEFIDSTKISFQFNDLREIEKSNGLPFGWLINAGNYNTLGARLNENGLRMVNYHTSAQRATVEREITLDVAKTYTVEAELASIDAGSVRVFFDTSTILTLTVADNKYTATGVSPANAETLLQLGRRTSNFDSDVVWKYVTITEDP